MGRSDLPIFNPVSWFLRDAWIQTYKKLAQAHAIY